MSPSLNKENVQFFWWCTKGACGHAHMPKSTQMAFIAASPFLCSAGEAGFSQEAEKITATRFTTCRTSTMSELQEEEIIGAL